LLWQVAGPPAPPAALGAGSGAQVATAAPPAPVAPPIPEAAGLPEHPAASNAAGKVRMPSTATAALIESVDFTALQ
jgi:hypothetical protein